MADLPEHSSTHPAPPLRGSTRADRRAEGGETLRESFVEPPSLSLPHKGGGDRQRRGSYSLRAAFIAAVRQLREAGIETAELDARLLICHAAGLTHEAFVAEPDFALSQEAQKRLEAAIARRLAWEPVSRIVGTREFYGRDFLVDRHTLDPRPDTETLIEAALGIVAHAGWQERKLRLLDLGTGTGCILLTLLAELPYAEGIGTDQSLGALALAARNARRLGVAERAAFVAGDWLAPIGGAFDLIVANPPYLTAGEMAALPGEVAHDPRAALDGGPDGLDAYRRIASEARHRLRPSGVILVEIGVNQADAVLGLLHASGLASGESALQRDLAERTRCVVARRLPEPGAEGRTAKKDLESRDVQVRFGAEIVTRPLAPRGAAGCNGNRADLS